MFFNASHSLFRRVRHADAVDVDALALLIAHLRWPGPVGAFGAATPALSLVALALLCRRLFPEEPLPCREGTPSLLAIAIAERESSQKLKLLRDR